jgi:putative hydrolase of the HAD superfamily
LSPNEKPFKAVTFDLWQTLIFESEEDNSIRSANRCRDFAKTLNKYGYDVSPSKVASAIEGTIGELLKIWDENKDVTHRDQLQYLINYALGNEARLKEDWVHELSIAYVSSIFDVPPCLKSDAKKTLQWIQSQDMRIGLICNTGITPGFALRKLLSQIGIAGFFESMIFSDEVGVRKPDSKVFRLAAKELGTKSREMIHVGDNLKTDVWGARSAGFRAIHLASEEGHDKQAENDPMSFMSRSKNLGKIGKRKLVPDATVDSLVAATKVIDRLQNMSKQSL